MMDADTGQPAEKTNGDGPQQMNVLLEAHTLALGANSHAHLRRSQARYKNGYDHRV